MHVGRRAAAAAVAGLLAVGCGGGGTPTPSMPASPSVDQTKIVSLDARNFDTLVLAGSRPSLVEFHSPT